MQLYLWLFYNVASIIGLIIVANASGEMAPV